MKDFSLQERSQFYTEAHPKWPPLRCDGRWIDGMWIMGNNYTTSGYYGAYPHTYLKRVMSIFPDATNVMHLFSGSLKPGNYTRVDYKNADVCADAHFIGAKFNYRPSFDLILADPPYSIEDCEHYGCCMVNRNKVVAECAKILQPGGFIVWLDQVLPMFSKKTLHWCGVIGMAKSTNHRFRAVTIFQRK